ncbi:hypothetical protein Pmani_040120, partial [Petrolisthes manimaculis]
NLVYGDVTSSTFVPNVTREDHNTEVTCHASNPAAPDHPITNTTHLVVHYPPSVSASLGPSLTPELLKEGDDVYFDCSVAANPPAATITWYHEGRPQKQNVSGGVILAGDGSLGAAEDKPVCETSPTTYFIYDKPINVTCSVSSYPPVRSIQWQWNSSNDVLSTSVAGELEERVSAQLTVQPTQSKEDRTLTCWAVNEMGKQTAPCGFSVKVARELDWLVFVLYSFMSVRKLVGSMDGCVVLNARSTPLPSLRVTSPSRLPSSFLILLSPLPPPSATTSHLLPPPSPPSLCHNLSPPPPFLCHNLSPPPTTANSIILKSVMLCCDDTESEMLCCDDTESEMLCCDVTETPLPLSSCRLANITASSLSLTCQRPDVAAAGTTLYRAEVYFENRTLFANVTSRRPNFNVSRLDAGTSYQIKVYVTHGPVTSQPVVVSAYTSRPSLTTPEDTFDLLAAGAKTEMPILSPVYEAVGVSMQEEQARVSQSEKSVVSGEACQGVREATHQDSDSESPRLPQHQHHRDSEDYPVLRPLHHLHHHHALSTEDMTRLQQSSPEDFPRVKFKHDRASPQDFPIMRRHQHQHQHQHQQQQHQQQHTRDDMKDFPRARYLRKSSVDLAEMSLLQKDPLKEFQSHILQQRAGSPRDHATLRLQHRDSGGRAELYCPVDQLMQAAETIV